MLDNILSIKNGTYVDEGILIDLDDKNDKKPIENVIISSVVASTSSI